MKNEDITKLRKIVMEMVKNAKLEDLLFLYGFLKASARSK